MTNVPEFGPFIKNKENAARLWTWLNDGAPHTAFDIEQSIITEPEECFDDILADAEEIAGHELPPECGTVCCIAGAADLMAHDLFGKLTSAVSDFSEARSFKNTQKSAISWLGLRLKDEEDERITLQPHYILPLFDPAKSSLMATGQQAAKALVNYSHFQDPKWAEARA